MSANDLEKNNTGANRCQSISHLFIKSLETELLYKLRNSSHLLLAPAEGVILIIIFSHLITNIKWGSLYAQACFFSAFIRFSSINVDKIAYLIFIGFILLNIPQIMVVAKATPITGDIFQYAVFYIICKVSRF